MRICSPLYITLWATLNGLSDEQFQWSIVPRYPKYSLYASGGVPSVYSEVSKMDMLTFGLHESHIKLIFIIKI